MSVVGESARELELPAVDLFEPGRLALKARHADLVEVEGVTAALFKRLDAQVLLGNLRKAFGHGHVAGLPNGGLVPNRDVAMSATRRSINESRRCRTANLLDAIAIAAANRQVAAAGHGQRGTAPLEGVVFRFFEDLKFPGSALNGHSHGSDAYAPRVHTHEGIRGGHNQGELRRNSIDYKNANRVNRRHNQAHVLHECRGDDIAHRGPTTRRVA